MTNAQTRLQAAQIVEVRTPLTFENKGQKIYAILHKPVISNACPVVVILHGLGGHRVGRYRVAVDLSAQLAAQGIASLRFDFRGAGDSEGDYSAITLEDQVSDALVVLNQLSKFHELDTSRIGISGRSLGGALSVLAASQFQEVKSLCLWAPIFDTHQWEGLYRQWPAMSADPSKAQELLTFEGQAPGIEFFHQFFRLNVPEPLATLDHLPLFVIHGNQDTSVLIAHGEKYMQARQNAAAETRFLQLPESDHHFGNRRERQIAVQETCNWFQKTL